MMALQHLPYCPDLSPPSFILFIIIQCFLKGQKLVSAKKVTAKAMIALTKVTKNGSQECFRKLYER
jgi:hypothetical protein